MIERYGIVLTAAASKVVEPSVLKPTFTPNADGSVTITVETGNEIFYTLTGSDPTTSTETHATTTVTISSSDLQSATAIKAIAHNSTDSKTSGVATLALATYSYKVVSKSNNIAISYSLKEAVGKPLSGYSSMPSAIRSPYISDETIV